MGSSRFHGKTARTDFGTSDDSRVADRALQTSANEVVVATDHADIAAIVTEAGYHAHMTLAEHPSGTDRIAQVAMGAAGRMTPSWLMCRVTSRQLRRS